MELMEEATVLDRLGELLGKIQDLHDVYLEEARGREQQELKECLLQLRQIGKEIDEIVSRLD